MKNRRHFLRAGLTAAAATLSLTRSVKAQETAAKAPPFKISLAGWSLHLAFFSKKLEHLDFPVIAKRDYGIEAVEYVNQFWKDKATDKDYLNGLKTRAADHGVTNVLIMCDGEGNLGDPDEARRGKAADNHRKWLDAAKFLGCHSIRVNAHSSGTREEQARLAADGLHRLSAFAQPLGLNVIVENHGGNSSDGGWLTGVIKSVGLPNCGTLPDFGNFKEYDRYKGVDEMMAFAKGVSAKSNVFDAQGNEAETDYVKMMEIVVKKHGYHGFVGIEYEGTQLSEPDGIKATKALLERIRPTLS
ncbi:MAG: sugar phosphate isomerase/epimerase [Verrucomicrobiaceae bacterium]|nr:MAG: sugar phosphate isomerase/epimerase [Verrucomicrobiaceae bacterium]